MKKDKNTISGLSTIITLRQEAHDKALEIQECENRCIQLAKLIATKKGISMVDYANYNLEMSELREKTAYFLIFTEKYKLSLRPSKHEKSLPNERL